MEGGWVRLGLLQDVFRILGERHSEMNWYVEREETQGLYSIQETIVAKSK